MWTYLPIYYPEWPFDDWNVCKWETQSYIVPYVAVRCIDDIGLNQHTVTYWPIYYPEWPFDDRNVCKWGTQIICRVLRWRHCWFFFFKLMIKWVLMNSTRGEQKWCSLWNIQHSSLTYIPTGMSLTHLKDCIAARLKIALIVQDLKISFFEDWNRIPQMIFDKHIASMGTYTQQS